MRFLALSLTVLSLACGDDSTLVDAGRDSGVGDAGGSDANVLDSGTDTSNTPDAESMLDAAGMIDVAMTDVAMTDGGEGDAGGVDDAGTDAGSMVDAGSDAGMDAGAMDAGPMDAGGACHAYTFGHPTIEFRGVASLPTMTGGVIPLGIYDAVDAQTTGALRPSYRATWVFEDASVLQTIEQLTISAPSTPTPRTQFYEAAGTSLVRTRTCPDGDSFDNQYRVRTEGDDVFLDVRQAGLLFTFQQR